MYKVSSTLHIAKGFTITVSSEVEAKNIKEAKEIVLDDMKCAMEQGCALNNAGIVVNFAYVVAVEINEVTKI